MGVRLFGGGLPGFLVLFLADGFHKKVECREN